MSVKKQYLCPKGPEISRIILGGWRWNDRSFPPAEQEKLINQSLEVGITSFDHADIYGNYNCQYLFGNVLKKQTALRDKIEIISKCGIKIVSNKHPERIIPYYDTSKSHIISSTEESLKALHTDYLDVLLIHRPDPLMNADEVAEAFTSLKKEGKVKHFGVSNFTNNQLDLLQSRLDFPIVSNQLEISLTHTELMFDGTLEHLQEKRISPMAWSPLGGGKLFSNRTITAQLNGFAKKYKVSNAALVIAWLLHHPSNIFPVVGTMNADRLKDMASAVEVKFDRQDWYLMLKIARGIDVP